MNVAELNLSEREHRQLALLHLLDGEGYRAAIYPEHDGDVIAGALWYALGVYWVPSSWELEWNRSLAQSYSHTFRRLQGKGYVGKHDDDQPAYGTTWSPDRYYFLTVDTEGIKIPKDLDRRCRYDGCDRWLPPTHREPVCDRCRFSRNYRESGAYKQKHRGAGFELFVRSGLVEVQNEELISRKHVERAYGLVQATRKAGTTLLDHWRDYAPEGPHPSVTEILA